MSLETDLQDISVTALEIRNWLGIARDTTVEDAVRKMRDERTYCALILEEGRLVGIFTDTDVLNKVLGHPENWKKPVAEVMTAQPQTVSNTSTAAEALNLLNTHTFRNLPVVDSAGQVVGNVGQESFIRYLSDRFHMHVYNQPPEFGRYAKTRHGA